MNPNIPLAVRSPQIDDPLTAQTKYLSLRDLLDQRRYREQQYEVGKLTLSEKQRALEEQARFREGLSKGLPLSELIKVAPTLAIPYGKTLSEQQKADVELKQSRIELTAKQKVRLANDIMAVMSLPADQRPAAYKKLNEVDYVAEGWRKPEEPYEPLPDEARAMQLAIEAFGQAQVQDWKDKRAAEARAAAAAAQQQTEKAVDISGKQLGYAAQIAPAIGNQAQYDEWRQSLPPEIAARTPAMYSPAAIAMVERMGIKSEQRAQMERQDWTTPGGLVAIATDPTRSEADKQRAAAGIQKHEDLRRAGAPTTITPNQQVANEAKARDDYMRDNKNFIAIRDAYSKIQGAARSQTGPGDISLVYGYMRMLDPGSTVREGEFATAQNAGGVPERIRAYWNKLVSGERLDPKVRQQFVDEAGKIYGQSRADYLKTRDMYSGIATRSNMDPRNVVIDLEPATPAPAAPKGRAPTGATGIPNPIVGPGQQVEVKAPNGKTYYFPNKAAADGFKKRARIP
jgi:hypothetical protein